MPATGPLWTDVINSISEAITALGSLITAFTAVLAGYIAWKKFVKEDAKTATPNILSIFEWEKQSAELRATKEGLEYYLYDVRPNRDKGNLWTLPIDRLKDARENINVSHSTRYPEWGLFSIGEKTDWYYSRKLFKSEEAFKNEIKDLIDRSLRMANS